MHVLWLRLISSEWALLHYVVSGAASGARCARDFFCTQTTLWRLPCANLEQLVANWSRDMRGSLHPLMLILLLLLSVSGQQEEDAAGENGVETDSSDEANPSEISDQQGTTSEEEVCSDCEETGNTIEGEELANNATELKVLESATFSMASVGSTSISVRLDRVDGQENLQMVCQ